MWWIYALTSAFFASLTAILAKIGISNVNSDLATAVRTIVIVIAAWAIVFLRGEQSGLPLLSRKTVLFLVLSGLSTAASWLMYFKALQIGKVSQVAPVDKLSVALTIILAAVFLQETLTLKVLIGAALIIAGTIVLIL
jgi:transporter family protein